MALCPAHASDTFNYGLRRGAGSNRHDAMTRETVTLSAVMRAIVTALVLLAATLGSAQGQQIKKKHTMRMYPSLEVCNADLQQHAGWTEVSARRECTATKNGNDIPAHYYTVAACTDRRLNSINSANMKIEAAEKWCRENISSAPNYKNGGSPYRLNLSEETHR
jgi:hypothetical protein